MRGVAGERSEGSRGRSVGIEEGYDVGCERDRKWGDEGVEVDLLADFWGEVEEGEESHFAVGWWILWLRKMEGDWDVEGNKKMFCELRALPVEFWTANDEPFL